MFMKSVCFSVFTLLCYTFVCNRGAIQCVCFCICLVLEISVYCVFKWVWSSLEDFFLLLLLSMKPITVPSGKTAKH